MEAAAGKGGEEMPENPLKKIKEKGVDHRIIYLGAAVVSALSVVQVQINLLPQAAGIVLYVLAAVLLAAACICLYQDLRKGIVERILLFIKKRK